MNTKITKFIILILMAFSASSGYRLIQKTYEPNYQKVTLKTIDGATIHENEGEKTYGLAISGDYLIHGPKDKKFMLAANVREWQLMTFIPQLIALLLFIFTFGSKANLNTESNSQNKNT